MPKGPCPLCGLEVDSRPLQNYDQHWIECPTCGTYRIGGLTREVGFDDTQRRKLHILSYLARAASDSGNHLIITQDNIESLFGSVVEWSPLDKMDRTLLYVDSRISHPDEGIDVNFDRDYPLLMARDGKEFGLYVNLLREQGFLDGPDPWMGGRGILMTPAGWQRADQLRKSVPDSNQAFVAMSFDPSLDALWEEGIEPALTSLGFNPYRVDHDPHNEKIDDRIVAEIRRSGILVADVTNHRPGVYYEAGLATGLNIPVFWTCRDTDIALAHFDTRQFNPYFPVRITV